MVAGRVWTQVPSPGSRTTDRRASHRYADGVQLFHWISHFFSFISFSPVGRRVSTILFHRIKNKKTRRSRPHHKFHNVLLRRPLFFSEPVIFQRSPVPVTIGDTSCFERNDCMVLKFTSCRFPILRGFDFLLFLFRNLWTCHHRCRRQPPKEADRVLSPTIRFYIRHFI